MATIPSEAELSIDSRGHFYRIREDYTDDVRSGAGKKQEIKKPSEPKLAAMITNPGDNARANIS